MSEKPKVWVLLGTDEVGERSVIAVFSTKDKADEYIYNSIWHWSPCSVAEFVVDQPKETE